MTIKAKNLNGTSINNPVPKCKCRTWLEHWENNFVWPNGEKGKAISCRCCGENFNHEELVGGHVITNSPLLPDHYIVPL